MAVTTKKTFNAVGTGSQGATVFTPVEIELNNPDDLDVYVTLAGGTRAKNYRQPTGSTVDNTHPQVNDTTGLYFPAVAVGHTLYNYTISTDNNTITFNSDLPPNAVVSIERRTRDSSSDYTAFAGGSTIRHTDLNNSAKESNFTAQEARNKAFELENKLFGGEANGTDFIESSDIVNGTILDEDINANAEIQVSKLKDGDARQVLQTAANGTDVEWTDSISLDGTLDVDGNTTVGGTLGVTSNTTVGGTLGVTSNTTVGGTLGVTGGTNLASTLHVTSHGNIGGTLDVTGESTLASATVSDLTSGRIVFTSTGGALVDSANLTFDNTGNGHLKVGVDGAYGDITCDAITATTWNNRDDNMFWRRDLNTIDHYGRDTGTGTSSHVHGIFLRKHDDHRLGTTNPSNPNYSHTFSIAKDYTFEVGRHYNEGRSYGSGSGLHYHPVLKVRQLIQQDRVAESSNNRPGQSSSDYTYISGGPGHNDSDMEFGSISIGAGHDYNLPTTEISLGGFTYFNSIKGGLYSTNNAPTSESSAQPVLMLSGQKGAMFVHPDNTSHINSAQTGNGLGKLARGVGGLGMRDLGDNYGFGNYPDGTTWTGSNTIYRSPAECMVMLEAACDLQIIVGGVRAKNKIEIGSSSVTGTLAISGTNVTSTATELNILDGVTATTAELNLLDGVTATTTELNVVDGVTATTTELNNLDGYTGDTSELNILDGVTATTTNLNIVDGMTKATSLTANSDTEYPTSKAVADHITTVIAPLGGLEVIATEVLFPNTQPDSGVVISISDAGGVVFNGSGVSTTATTVDGSTVTINGAPSSLYSETLVAGVGLMVSSTGSSQTYNYHKILGKEDDIKQLSDDINDFNARYRIESSAPSSNNDDGDLYYDTTLKKMKVYNAVTSQWDDVAQSSSSYIVTLSEAFNGTLQDFTMSTAATDAQSTLVSINGVLQKPNAGTSTPSEGFAISGNTLKLAAAPPTDSNYFVVVLGDTVSIGTPSDNTVTSAKIVDGSIVNGDISSSAAIAGSKIAPDFGSQDPTTTGKLITNSSSSGDYIRLYAASGTGKWDIYGNGANLRISDNDSAGKVQIDRAVLLPDDVKLEFGDVTTPDLEIYHNASNSYIDNNTGSLIIRTNVNADVGGDIFLKPHDDEDGISIVHDAEVALYYGGAGPKFETTSTGVQITGDIVLTGSGTSTTNSLDISYDATSGVASINADSSGGNTSLSFGTSNSGTLGTDQLSINKVGQAIFKGEGTSDNGSIEIQSDDPFIRLNDTNGAADKKKWDIRAIGSTSYEYLEFRTCEDDNTDFATKLKIWHNGNLDIPDGNLRIGTSGHGILFDPHDVTPTAPGSDSNLLSDYEEGTYEPTFTCQNSGSFTPETYVTLDYVKIGKLCHIQGYINMNGSSGSVSGPLRMSLPFVTGNGAHYDTAHISVSMRGHGDTLPNISGATDQGQTFMEFIATSADGSHEWVNGPTLNTSWNIRIAGSYKTAD